MQRRIAGLAIGALVIAACSGGGTSSPPPTSTSTSTTSHASTTVASTASPTTGTPTTIAGDELMAGAASRSVMPTVNGTRDYLKKAPGWDHLDPNDIGVFVPAFDQGKVDVGNGNDDGSWVHDDLRTTALVLAYRGQTVVMVTADVYMIFAADSAEIERRVRAKLPGDFPPSTHIIISATHDHHGPDTAFSVNPKWYDTMANQMVEAIIEANRGKFAAHVEAASGMHRFGQADARDPLIVDPRLNVMRVVSNIDDRTIATVVQWSSHPETTLGWKPPGNIAAQCKVKGWTGDKCYAEGRYFTADYPGVLRERVQAALGGEVLYFNGPIGSQIGPGHADVWQVDAAHPEGDGVTPPTGAKPVPGTTDFRGQSMARTEAIGAQLATDVLQLLKSATPVTVDHLDWKQQPYYTRLTNIGFRVLLADGSLGWQTPHAYNCGAKPFTDATCKDDRGVKVDDPVLTPLVDSQVRKGDVLKTQLTWVGLGDVGFLFMPGELPPELVIGLPSDFVANTAKYYSEPKLHATGKDYVIPGALLDLVPTKQTFTVGLGGDELGYWTPINEVRLKCLDLVMPKAGGYTCQKLYDEGMLVTPDAIGGPACRALTDDTEATSAPSNPAQIAAMKAVCRYGQALGRELGEPAGHYEETNSAGWDLVDDTWTAAQALFKK